MRIKAEVKGSDLVDGIAFFGDTRKDAEVVEKIKQLTEFIENVFIELSEVCEQTENRNEASGCYIHSELANLRHVALWTLCQAEDIPLLKEIIYEMEGEIR